MLADSARVERVILYLDEEPANQMVVKILALGNSA